MSDRKQTIPEEVANTITHAIGVVFCLTAMPFLLIYTSERNTTAMVWSVLVFGFGMLMAYLSSTLYHAVQSPKLKKALQIWDHISIFLLIAGSYTPVVIKFIPPDTATIFLITMWCLVACGSFLKLFFTGRFKILSVLIYLLLGWMAVFILQPLIRNVPLAIWWWILAGGLFYTVGVLFFLWHRLKFHHAVWHVFVLSGTVTHFIAVYKSIDVVVPF